MIADFSVKKPFYILAIAIVSIVLGVYTLMFMKTDLYPEMDLPYLAVITTDTGASPEKVESDVTSVLVDELTTVSGVKNVTSQSAENYSMIFLEFEEDTDMDSALVKVSAAVNTVSTQLPDSAGTPMYMEINMDSVATTYLGVALDGKTQAETSAYVKDTVIPALERQEGVASVKGVGLVANTVSVELSQSKIDDINNKLLASVNDQLYDAKKQIDEGYASLDEAEAQIEAQEAALSETQSSTSDQLGQASAGLSTAVSVSTGQLTTLQAAIQALKAQDSTGSDPDIQAQIAQLQEQAATAQAQLSQYQQQLAQVESGEVTAGSSFGSATAQLASAKSTLESSRSQLDSAEEQYESSREQAISSANIDALLDISTLSGLITSQNFSMPAGYINGEGDKQWMLKVGEEYASVDDLSNMVLTSIDGVGDIRLADVADITVLSNEGDTYSKLNGQDGIIVTVTKASSAATSDVSNAVKAEMAELQSQNPDLQVMILSDQGKYIDLYISTILQGLLVGAVLAVIVLALFLKAVRPTLVLAFSIPFSVMLALVIMYFWGLSLNMMTLSALSLAIGMLVDNSVVVLENIYRLRARGLSPERAAAQGAKQVTAAVVASTLTTICVFFPMVFTTGVVRQIMVPFALAISFTLLASLLVALTCVPAMGSRLLSEQSIKEVAWFERLKQVYGLALAWCLQHKAPVLSGTVALAVVALIAVFSTGIVLIPSMGSNQVSVTMTMPEGMSQDEAESIASTAAQRIKDIDGIEDVGVADRSALTSIMSGGMSMGGSSDSESSDGFMIYATVKSSVVTQAQMDAIQEQVKAAVDGLNCEHAADVSAATSSVLSGETEIEIRGDDPDVLLALSNQVMDAMKSLDGYTEISNGQEDADETLQLVFDKNEVAQDGTTVAQIYQQLVAKLNSSADVTTLDTATDSLNVKLENNRNQITRENLLDTTFTVSNGSDGSSTEYRLGDVATVKVQAGLQTLTAENGTHYMTVTAEADENHNTTLLARDLQPKLDQIEVPDGYTVEISGTNETINSMIEQMLKLMVLGALLIYLIMMAQFGSFRAPFIIILTVPLAFTGGMFALLIGGEQLSVMSLLGFVVLMGTIVNNGIVFVDFANQLRQGGMEKQAALVATGMARMRPILMTALTTIMAMCAMIFNPEIGASLERGMALVVAGGLLYGTLTTLFVVPMVYDLIWRKPMKVVDLSGDIDDAPDDAAAFIAQMGNSSKGGLYELNQQMRVNDQAARVKREQRRRTAWPAHRGGKGEMHG